MTASTGFGLILPLGSPESDEVSQLIAESIIHSVWVRDLPVVAAQDEDAGQGSDPWWCLGRLVGAGPVPRHIGTASIILGVRHPLVVARAAASVQVETHGRFILGVGSGGKPEMNRALGIAGRGYDAFAQEWAALRAALAPAGSGVDLQGLTPSLRLPTDYRPPPMYLATSDPKRWEAIDGDADGWQTFLTDDHAQFEALHAQVNAIRGSHTPTDLRLDVHLTPTDDGPSRPEFTCPQRGRVRCTAAQLPALIRPWLGPPVDRLLLRLSGQEPGAALRGLRAN